MDELPQLWNVLKGDMSLVGPRPILEKEIPFYGDSIHLYSKIRSGITGLWQISGRSNPQFADRVALDNQYMRNWLLWIDIVILFKTVKVVLKRSGAF
jgi:lipopolysaccharide/colanic/teichoic acid biosynthesis glycosyltransferase